MFISCCSPASSVPPSSVARFVRLVITGAVVSTTLTVLVAVEEISEASVAVYVIVYAPNTDVSTVPAEVTVTVSKSVAVAPASVYVPPNSAVGFVPVTVITLSYQQH